MMPELSIVVVHWNVPELLDACLRSIAAERGRAAGFTCETIVVDCASPTDGHRAVVAAHSDVTLIELAENRGYAAGCNTGLAASRGDAVLLLNPDIELEPGSLEALYRGLRIARHIGMTAPLLLNPDGSQQSAGYRFPGPTSLLFDLLPVPARLVESPLNGRALVGELNRCGIIVDCSHTGYRTTMDVMEISSDPVVFSHSNAKEINAHDRNITREQAEACARTGGVVGVVGFDGFLRDNVMSVSNIVEQIDYYCDIIGSDHVGLGLDWMFWEAFPEFLAATAGRYKPGQDDTEIRFSPPEVLPQITEMLMARGYTEQDIRKIMGENWLRVARAVW